MKFISAQGDGSSELREGRVKIGSFSICMSTPSFFLQYLSASRHICVRTLSNTDPGKKFTCKVNKKMNFINKRKLVIYNFVFLRLISAVRLSSVQSRNDLQLIYLQRLYLIPIGLKLELTATLKVIMI